MNPIDHFTPAPEHLRLKPVLLLKEPERYQIEDHAEYERLWADLLGPLSESDAQR